MSSIYDKVYPNNGRLLFDGGKSNKFVRSIIPDNESPDCANVIFENGAVETRGGTSKLNTTTVGTYLYDGLYTRHSITDNAETMVGWWNGTLYALNTTTFITIPSSQSLYTAGERVCAAEYENYIFFCNGGSTAYKYGGAGNTFTRHGIEVPSALSVATSDGGTGNISTGGTYSWKCTYVNTALAEGDLGSAVTLTLAANSNASFTCVPVAPQSYGVYARRIYRYDSDNFVYKRVGEISDNTTTTFIDNVDTPALGVDAPLDAGLPPKYKAVIYHQARLFVIDPITNLINYSDEGNPYVFASTSFLRVGDTTFDVPKGFSIFDNSVVVHCLTSNWIIYMPSSDDTTWRIVKVRSSLGSKSPFGSFNYNNKIMFPAVQNNKFVGFAAISGDTTDPSATLLTVSAAGSLLKSDRIEPDMFEVQAGYLDEISSIVHKNKAYITLTRGNGETQNNYIYVWDFSISNLSKNQEGSWVPWTGLNARQFTEFNGDIYYASSDTSGFVYMMNTNSYSDDGTAIDSYFWTKEYAGHKGDENTFKDFRYAQIFYEKSGDYFMNFGIRVDSDKGEGSAQQIDLNPGGSLWGSMRWGFDLWGGGSDEGEDRLYLSPSRGKRIQFKFSNQNTLNQKFKVLGLNFTYLDKGKR